MSNVQIPGLPAAIALNGTEQIEAVQAGTSVRITVSQMVDLVPQGPVGPQGPAGPQGPTGAQGNPGANGATQTVETTAAFEATSFDVATQSVQILGDTTIGVGAYQVQRVSSQPVSGLWLRSQDRYLPNGSTSSTNGGYWAFYFAEDYVQPSMISCWGDSLTEQGYPEILSGLLTRPCFNFGVSGDTAGMIKVRFDNSPNYWPDTTVFWVGRNNVGSGTLAQAGIDTAAMVASLGHDRYIVMSVINSVVETVGTTAYDDIVAYNATLAATYGPNYLDIRSLLVAQGTPAEQALGIPPAIFEKDGLHLNTAGYTFVAEQLQIKLVPVENGQNALISEDDAANERLSARIVTYPGQIAIGRFAMAGTTSPGQNNVAIGDWALRNNTGNSSTAVGYRAGYEQTAGYQNTWIGNGAGFSTTTGYNNVAVGHTALTLNTTGFGNAAVGAFSLYNNTTGQRNIGILGLFNNSTGNRNIGIGGLNTNIAGNNNVAVGSLSLDSHTGSSSTGVGYATLYNATGSFNVAIGSGAGYDLTTGAYNTFIGTSTGGGLTTGSNNTIIGARIGAATPLSSGLTGAILIGTGATDAVKANYNLDLASGWSFSGPIVFSPGASVTPTTNGQVTFELTNNTTLTIKAKGSDGTVRSATITLS